MCYQLDTLILRLYLQAQILKNGVCASPVEGGLCSGGKPNAGNDREQSQDDGQLRFLQGQRGTNSALQEQASIQPTRFWKLYCAHASQIRGAQGEIRRLPVL
jgi:hypothetical protein